MSETLQQKELRELERKMARAFGWTQWRRPYSALPTPTSIRLLEFAAGRPDTPEQPIRCTFKLVDLNDLPVYSALSYTWGNPRGLLPPGETIEADRVAMSMMYPIVCDGEIIEVTASCYSFIQRFQQLQKSIARRVDVALGSGLSTETITYIWIDAVCINQDSMAEKSSQVRIMDRVYTQASEVLIWIGPDDTLTRGGFRALLQLAKMCDKIYDMPAERSTVVVGRLVNSPLFKKHGLPDITPSQWQGLICLLRRTWFSRSWTVQEFILARHVSIMCGPVITEWQSWYRAVRFLIQAGWTDMLLAFEYGSKPTLRAEGLEDYFTGTQSVSVIHGLREQCCSAVKRLGDLHSVQSSLNPALAGFTFPLQRILGMFGVSECSLPHDRIYAYLGLVPEASWRGLTIDYERSPLDTYIQATWAMIKATRSLSILSHVEDKSCRSRKFQKLPSWVPDYSARWFAAYLDPGSTEKLGGSPPGFFDCTRGCLHEVDVTNTFSRSLKVLGCLHSVVEYVDNTKAADSTSRRFFHLNQPEAILRCVRNLPQDYLWRTLVSDQDLWDHRHPASTRSARYIFQVWISALRSMAGRIRVCESNKLTSSKTIELKKIELRKAFISYVVLSRDYRFLDVGFANWVHAASHLSYDTICQHIRTAFAAECGLRGDVDGHCVTHAELSSVVSGLKTHMEWRLLLVTSDCRIGKGPCSTRVGDEVWVLSGARVPYILRPLVDDRYELVGEAYVHGIMHGEEFGSMQGKFRPIEIV